MNFWANSLIPPIAAMTDLHGAAPTLATWVRARTPPLLLLGQQAAVAASITDAAAGRQRRAGGAGCGGALYCCRNPRICSITARLSSSSSMEARAPARPHGSLLLPPLPNGTQRLEYGVTTSFFTRMNAARCRFNHLPKRASCCFFFCIYGKLQKWCKNRCHEYVC